MLIRVVLSDRKQTFYTGAMMPFSNKYRSYFMLFVFFLISVVFFVNYFLSNSYENKLFQRVRQSKENTDFTQYSKVSKNKVFLVKNNSVTINKCKLVFTGIEDKIIHLDLYLLDLDPQYVYHQNISKTSAIEGFRLGDSEYQLISVNKKILKLKITNLFNPN